MAVLITSYSCVRPVAQLGHVPGFWMRQRRKYEFLMDVGKLRYIGVSGENWARLSQVLRNLGHRN